MLLMEIYSKAKIIHLFTRDENSSQLSSAGQAMTIAKTQNGSKVEKKRHQQYKF
jgi:hypothetical protein